MSEEERQWVIDNVEEICARTNDIDEICCALEHSTIFVIEHLQTIVTDFLKLQQENEQLKEELKYTVPIVEHNKIVSEKLKENEQLKNKWNELKKWLEEEIDYCSGTDNMDFISMKNAYESTMLEIQELEGSNE